MSEDLFGEPIGGPGAAPTSGPGSLGGRVPES